MNGQIIQPAEWTQLESLEGHIAVNLKSFYTVGKALQAIRDGRLYKVRGYNTFEQYCADHWGFTRDYSHKQISASNVADAVGVAHKKLDTNCIHFDYVTESHLRPLIPLTEEQQRHVWRVACETSPTRSNGERRMTAKHVSDTIVRVLGEDAPRYEIDIIKPSDWWSFGVPRWQKEGFDGSIPGEIYANALYYFAPKRGVAVDAMGGSGTLRRVYDDRDRWQKDSGFNLDVYLFDKHPREPFATKYNIRQHDIQEHPLDFRADWLFIDPPYFKAANGYYDGDLSQMTDYGKYLAYMGAILFNVYLSLNPGGVFCLFLPPFVDASEFIQPYIDIPSDMVGKARSIGFELIRRCYVNRAIQQHPDAGSTNNKAKAMRMMKSDTCELIVLRMPA